MTGNWVDDVLSVGELQEGGRKFNLSPKPSLELKESSEEKILPKNAYQNHEKPWEYTCALQKTELNLMPNDIYGFFQEHSARKIIIEMEKIYKMNNPKLHTQFLKELLNG